MAKKTAKPKLGPSVTIRMYCQGLGDCFLLTFPPAKGKKPVRVLIDCGVLQRTPAEPVKMRAVADSIKKDTGGHVDLLIVTHEHWDHVAGFAHAKDVFESITFDRVWLSWAEDLDNPDTQKLKTELGKKKKALHAALGAAKAHLGARGDDPLAARLRGDLRAVDHVMGFFGLAAAEDGAAPAATKKTAKKKKADGPKTMTLGETMDWLREKVRPGDFCVPGERRALPGATGINLYVLGPPKAKKSITKMDPTGDQGYRHHADKVSLLGALEWLVGDQKDDPAAPFDDTYRVKMEDAKADPFFREFYGFADDLLGDAGMAWRRIDDEWLGGAGQLALQLDRGVNNTSLALAFELPGGRTLIFPGDAQIGNWLSWDALESFTDEAGKKVEIAAPELLRNAIFYKVGHHGSHNATRKVGGLEAMGKGDLVAMIPTDETFALTQSPPHGWKMPFHDLNEALKQFTHHRILRADQGQADLDAAAKDGQKASAARWQEFAPRVTFAKDLLPRDDEREKDAPDQPLYVEYAIPL